MDFQTFLTRVLKVIAVIGLVSLATFLVLIEVGLRRYHGHPTWHFHVGAGIGICFCLCAAYLLVQPRKDSVAQIYCAKCHTLGGHEDITPYRSTSEVNYHLGGALLSLFRAASRKHRFRCRQCGADFETHTGTSRAYQILYLMMIGFIVNGVWSQIAEFWAE